MTPPRPRDPQRMQRIARATVDVVAKRGVEGLTHRAVAAEAQVPLGSTTYYFRSLDDLLAAAIVLAKADGDARLGAWRAAFPPDPDLAVELTRLLVDETGGDHRMRTLVEYELYLAAMRRPALHEIALAWDRAIPDLLSEFTDTLTAEALALASDGLALQSMIRGRPLRANEVEPMLRRILGSG